MQKIYWINIVFFAMTLGLNEDLIRGYVHYMRRTRQKEDDDDYRFFFYIIG